MRCSLLVPYGFVWGRRRSPLTEVRSNSPLDKIEDGRTPSNSALRIGSSFGVERVTRDVKDATRLVELSGQDGQVCGRAEQSPSGSPLSSCGSPPVLSKARRSGFRRLGPARFTCRASRRGEPSDAKGRFRPPGRTLRRKLPSRRGGISGARRARDPRSRGGFPVRRGRRKGRRALRLPARTRRTCRSRS
jgi:hypothetical protein